MKDDLAIQEKFVRDGVPPCLTDSTWPWCPFDRKLGDQLPQVQSTRTATLNDTPPLLPRDGFILCYDQVLQIRILGDVPLVKSRHVCLNAHPRFLVAKNDLLLLLFNEVFPKLAKSFVLSGSR